MKYSLEDIYKKLEKIISDQENRLSEIKEFQTIVWNDDISFSSEVDDCLADLAQDLDYYEINEEVRKEDSSYYGEERLVNEINTSLNVIKKYL